MAVEESLGFVKPFEKLPIALLQLLRRHLRGYDIAIDVMEPQPARLFQSLIERRFRHRRKHADHRQENAVVLNKSILVFEDRQIVVVESDDKAGADLHPSIANPCQLGLKRIAAGILILFSFVERRFTRRFDADKYRAKV